MMELARTELAALTAGLKFWGGWVQAADKYTRGINSELERAGTKGGNAREFTSRLADLTRGYLREMAELPNMSVKHFVDELEHARTPTKRKRRARAKA
jgi:hypothetical protein